MKRIVMLIEELGSQMKIHLALCEIYNILLAENIESAMYFLRRAKPDLLLMDYNLEAFKANRKKAVSFITKIKKKYEHLKIVTLLDSVDREHQFHTESGGADSVICRPIEKENLIANLHELTNPTYKMFPDSNVLVREKNNRDLELITA